MKPFPLAEQRRIVAKLLALCDGLEASEALRGKMLEALVRSVS